MKRNYLLWAFILVCIVPMLSCACRSGVKSGQSNATVQNGTTANASARADSKPVQYTFQVKNTYPHNPTSYTQGLYWHDGYLWEGTGQRHQSALLKVELETGRIVESVPLPDRYFGEGIALLGGKIYQLTWTGQTAFVYDAGTLEKMGELPYKGEGWGLTTDGEKLYMSDGSNKIHVVDPDTFAKEKEIGVRIGRRDLYEINELEWIGGKIWANIYMSDSIVIIDPQTGTVEGVIDLQDILPVADRLPGTDVLNGIAYDEQTGRIFVTGKNWNKLFEIEIREK